VFLAVRDQGPGVPDDQLERIFDPFFRSDAVRTPGAGGVGLGLSIVRTCVEACGGTVEARHNEPRGLAIVMQLAAARTPAAGPSPVDDEAPV